MELSLIIRQIAIIALPILMAIVMHEVSHGFIANKLGDPTAKMMGRLTLNPIAHIDLFGTVLMPILLFIFTNGQFVFGYAKPVPINPYNFKNPKRDMAISAAGGPAINILLAVISALTLKYLFTPLASSLSDNTFAISVIQPLMLMLNASIKINSLLAVFNMIPIPPLDGGRVLMGFLPYKQAEILSRIEPYGMIIVILLIITNITGYIIFPIVKLFINLLNML